MAKNQFNDPLKQLRNLAEQDQQKQPARRESQSGRRRRQAFEDPLDKVSTRDAARATKSKSMIGNYAQRTFRLPPEYLDMIRVIAGQEIMSIADAERWVVWRGLIAYFEDQERPEFEQSVQRQVHLPAVGGG